MIKRILEDKERRVIGILFIATASFSAGYWLHKPKVVTIEKVKEIKVYDFNQEPKMMEIYANTMGKTLKNLDEYNKQKEVILTEIRSLGIEELKAEIEKERLEAELKKLRNPERKKRWYQF